MTPGAQSPEELETLFEDAFVMRDHEAVVELFDDGAVMAVRDGDPPAAARGGEEIERLVAELWGRGRVYLADATRVLQARDTALVVAHRGIHVVRRGHDGAWRYVISLLALDESNPKEDR
jgi:hypothetical protein